MDYGPIYCAACGLRVDTPGRICPKCGEPLPAPPTRIGYADPSKPPQAEPEQGSSSAFGTSPLAMTPFPSPKPQEGEQQPAAPIAPPPPEAIAPVVVRHSERSEEPLPPPPDAPVVRHSERSEEPLPPPPIAQAFHKAGTEQLAPAPAALQPTAVAPTVPDDESLPQEKARPRNKLAGVFGCIWGLLLLAVGIVFSGIHLAMILRHGFWNLHEALRLAFWVSIALVPVALLQSGAGLANLLGRLAPRALSALALLAQIAWAVVAVVVIESAFLLQGPVLLLIVLAGTTVLPSLVGAILSWVAARR